MNNIHTKKINSITILLWVFILFIIIVFGYLIQLSKYIDLHSNYHDKVNELKIIDKEFDNFLLQQAVFINYDKINKSVFIFDENMKYLRSTEALNTHSEEYTLLVKEIEKLYEDKLSSIEYFKSENSQFLYSMHYLFDLNTAILKSKSIDVKTKDIANATLTLLSKQYINATIENSSILKKPHLLKSEQ